MKPVRAFLIGLVVGAGLMISGPAVADFGWSDRTAILGEIGAAKVEAAAIHQDVAAIRLLLEKECGKAR